jgi:hypothetical protein
LFSLNDGLDVHLAELLSAHRRSRDGIASAAATATKKAAEGRLFENLRGAGRFVELAGRLDVEAEASETALHVAALGPVETDLVFAHLAALLGESSTAI